MATKYGTTEVMRQTGTSRAYATIWAKMNHVEQFGVSSTAPYIWTDDDIERFKDHLVEASR
jgi:hypothetical protein